ncbi:hypothetical protein C2S51_028521 [Perilla frutescens var. frutescens]|nr:hypothetical protein C2S51_028521 [Perilla frutescens var. frutescens]
MNESRRNQVSLRGASTKEITRDALLDRVNQERELRNYARRAKAAALLIQRVWRRHHAVESAALRVREEWEMMITSRSGSLTGMQMSREILRPFLFFINYLSVRLRRIGARDRDCMISCFRIVLDDITSNDVRQSFCSLTIGSTDERKLWFHQSKKLISVCLCVLSLFDYSHPRVQDVVLTSIAMRLSVILTDPKGWNHIPPNGQKDANTAVKNLSCKQMTDFAIVASAITLSLRPFHLTNIDINDKGMMESAIEQYCISLLTIPWFPQRLPAILVPALRHKSVLSPCLRTLLVRIGHSEKLLTMSKTFFWSRDVFASLSNFHNMLLHHN